jgi:hypothetical protein
VAVVVLAEVVDPALVVAGITLGLGLRLGLRLIPLETTITTI